MRSKRRYDNINPVFFEKTKDGEILYDVYARLVKDRIIFLHEEIDSNVASVIVALLLVLDEEDKEEPISLYINSPGGSVESFFAIYDVMQLIHAPIKTICVGEASSAAAILLAAGSAGMRFATVNSRIMIHQIQIGSVEGSGTDLENTAKEVKALKKKLTEVLARHTGQSYKKVLRDCEIDKYLSAMESKEYGLVDEILLPTKNIPEIKPHKHVSRKKKTIPPPEKI